MGPAGEHLRSTCPCHGCLPWMELVTRRRKKMVCLLLSSSTALHHFHTVITGQQLYSRQLHSIERESSVLGMCGVAISAAGLELCSASLQSA